MSNVRILFAALVFILSASETRAEPRECGFTDYYFLFMAEGRFENLRDSISNSRKVFAGNEQQYCHFLNVNVSALRNACSTLESGPCKKSDNSVYGSAATQQSCKQLTRSVEGSLNTCRQKKVLSQSSEPSEVDVASDETFPADSAIL